MKIINMVEHKDVSSDLEKEEELINVKDLITIFTKNWKWFALSVILFLGFGMYYLATKNSIYAVDALVLLKEDDKKSASSSSMMSLLSGIGDLGSMMGTNSIDNEIVVFKTQKIMKKSILDLNLYITSRVHEGLKTINPYPLAPFNITVNPLQVDTIQSTIKLTLKPVKNGAYKIKGQYKKIKFETVVDHFPTTIQTPSIDVHIEKNPYAPEEKEPKIVDVSIYNPNILAVLLSKNMVVKTTSKKTTIIRLSTETDNVEWAQDLLNKVIETFNWDAIEDKKMISTLTAQFVNERLDSLEKELMFVERQIEKYKQDNNLTDISSEAKLFLEQMGESEKMRIETQIQLNMIQYIESYVKDAQNQNKLIPSIGIEDKGLVMVIAKYNETLAEHNRLENTSTISNPALQLTNNQLVSMRQNILENINNLVGSMQVRIDDLKKQDAVMNLRIRAIPRQEREFIEIRRQQGIKATLYSYLLQKREETSLSLASTTDKAKIIDEPMPGIDPIAPQKSIILLVVTCLGMIFPLVFFYLKKILKTVVDSKEELESLSKVEVIGEICRKDIADQIVVKANETDSSAELFRLLRTNLSFVLNDENQKVIITTSTISGEGKTYISINLATSLAFLNKKILVVGLDIRNPRLGDYLEMPTGKGVTNYLIDDKLTAADIIQHSGIHPNLDIIQAGTIPPNPSELLMNPRLDDLFTHLRSRYDYIIVDTAPVGLVSDTFSLNRITDVCLYIARIGMTHRESIRYLNSIHDRGRLKRLYLIANDIDLKEKNGGYGYGYGYKKK